jgi:hypothetical protein
MPESTKSPSQGLWIWLPLTWKLHCRLHRNQPKVWEGHTYIRGADNIPFNTFSSILQFYNPSVQNRLLLTWISSIYWMVRVKAMIITIRWENYQIRVFEDQQTLEYTIKRLSRLVQKIQISNPNLKNENLKVSNVYSIEYRIEPTICS